jgi:CubicO group peptidase (beta-lactamase class C family)
MNVQGSCDAQFQAVRGEFERNFQDRREVGASVCVVLRGQIVVNLWGGTARSASPVTEPPMPNGVRTEASGWPALT